MFFATDLPITRGGALRPKIIIAAGINELKHLIKLYHLTVLVLTKTAIYLSVDGSISTNDHHHFDEELLISDRNHP